MPPANMLVFSTVTSDARAWWSCSPSRTSRTASRGSTPPTASSGVNWIEALRAAAPISKRTTWSRRPEMTTSPGRVSTRSAIWLAMTPEGTNTAAGLSTTCA